MSLLGNSVDNPPPGINWGEERVAHTLFRYRHLCTHHFSSIRRILTFISVAKLRAAMRGSSYLLHKLIYAAVLACATQKTRTGIFSLSVSDVWFYPQDNECGGLAEWGMEESRCPPDCAYSEWANTGLTFPNISYHIKLIIAFFLSILQLMQFHSCLVWRDPYLKLSSLYINT